MEKTEVSEIEVNIRMSEWNLEDDTFLIENNVREWCSESTFTVGKTKLFSRILLSYETDQDTNSYDDKSRKDFVTEANMDELVFQWTNQESVSHGVNEQILKQAYHNLINLSPSILKTLISEKEFCDSGLTK